MLANGGSAGRIMAALLIGAGCAVGGWFIGQGVERFRTADRTVVVKGLAERPVKSDYAVWGLAFRRPGDDFAKVQTELLADRERVVEFLKGQGFTEAEIEPRPLQVTDRLARDYSDPQSRFRYVGVGTVVVKSARVDAVADAANRVDPLVKAGVTLSGEPGAEGTGGPPRYLLRGFNELKPQILAEAVKNAREQAQRFAQDAGARVGQLKSANQGVIRILDDDGQDHDTTNRTLMKRVRVVSTLEFALD